MRVSINLFAGMLGLATFAEAHSQVLPENLVVMIRAYDETDTQRISPRTKGAGIVLNQTPDTTTILTACHVVLPAEESGKKWEVEIEFKTLIGRPFRVSVPRRLCDRKLDYALLLLDGKASTLGVPSVLPPGQAGLLSQIGPDEPARIVSFMSSRPDWQGREVTTRSVSPSTIQLKQPVEPGASGGGLFDRKGHLVGMLRASDVEGGQATPIILLVEELKQLASRLDLRSHRRTWTSNALIMNCCASP
jgi:S1-C subfamily serine protease